MQLIKHFDEPMNSTKRTTPLDFSNMFHLIHTVFIRMYAAATKSGEVQRLFEGGYYSRAEFIMYMGFTKFTLFETVDIISLIIHKRQPNQRSGL